MNYKKDIDNIVWLIPIKKIRNSLREYLTKLIKDNEFIKLQNNFIIKELYEKKKQGKEELLEKELNINDLSDFWKKYNKINESYNEVCIYLGIGTGFFSEFNNLILAILYCLVNKIKFKLYLVNAKGFTNNKGFEEFFMPFCKELIYDADTEFNNICNFPKNEVEVLLSAIKEKYGINYFGYMGSDIFNKMRHNDFRNSHFKIKELGIDGDIYNAFGIIAKNIFRFNNETKKEIYKLINNLNLPKKYIGFHIRAGDKITEAELIKPEKYIESLKKHSDIKDIFISTDDYSVVEKLKNQYGSKYNIYTLTNKKELGYNQYDFEMSNKNEKYNHLIEFFASIEILLNSELCFGSYTSNPSIFLGAVLGKEKFIEVNSLDFRIR
ncbi:hypothetical protein [Brachyspira aalborgi]|uniref:Alpha-(1,6)-fucosyltransferase N- and catalytic domain-containing protein n=1 Tax=Brachyspira aalborgi TaxID=29522 RepID=A0A5C8EM81_9SPIR|nr:hypothetical protein [Brachyspira aalborgi]TXJ38031.1 hypothetical protein EPJ78_04815 [Brachyspira aalborgi]